jgi:hypothetical protein
MSHPLPNRLNGRSESGRFTTGNPGGPGNPYNRRVQEIRAELLDALKEGDVADIIQKLIEKAKGGDVVAAREVLDRALGKSHQSTSIAATPPPEPTLAEIAAACERLGVPENRWPLRALEWRKRQQAQAGSAAT